ncbi:MAG: hypothetical protein ACI308_09615 [Muribaculaceae bacterium]
MDDKNIYSRAIFIDNLTRQLVKLCTSRQMLNNVLYDLPELMEKWQQSAPQYMADAVPEIPRYPMVAIGWAIYYGMGAAAYWDGAWDQVKDCPDLYKFIRDKRGFDYMDEYVTQELVGIDLNSKKQRDINEANALTSCIQECAQLALTMIRKQGIEPQSTEAFYMYAAVEKVMFHLGLSMQMYRMGYRYEKLTIN